MYMGHAVPKSGIIDFIRMIQVPDSLGCLCQLCKISPVFLFGQLEILCLVVLKHHNASSLMLLVTVQVHRGIVQFAHLNHQAV